MPSKSQLMTVAYTLLALAIINKVDALEPVKKAIMDKGFL